MERPGGCRSSGGYLVLAVSAKTSCSFGYLVLAESAKTSHPF